MDYVVKNPKLLNIFKFSFDASVWQDAIFITITDEELEDLLEFVARKDLLDITPDESYGVLLLGKSEIYWKLATSTAPLYKIEVDGTSVEKNQRFDHYIKLITELDTKIKRFEDNSLPSTVIGTGEARDTGEAILTSRHSSARNYSLTLPPVVNLTIDNIYDTKIELSWETKGVTKFYNYIIYISNNKIIDDYINKGLGNRNVASEESILVDTILDIHQTKYRIEKLLPNTTYHVAVLCFNVNSVFGYKELEFITTGVI